MELVETIVALIPELLAGRDVNPRAPNPAPASNPAPAPNPAPEPEPERREPSPRPEPEPEAEGFVLFAGGPSGYGLLERDGSPPARGSELELEGERYVVLRLGPSPLPGDRRRCAFLERQEPSPTERTPGDGVKEESQLEEMRAALRGDRERAGRSRPKFLQSLAADTVPEPPEQEPEERGRRTIRSLFRRR